MAGAGQVIRLGVDRQEQRVAGNPVVEVIDQGDEEGQAAGRRIDRVGFLEWRRALVPDREAAGSQVPWAGRIAQRDRCQDLPSVWVDGA